MQGAAEGCRCYEIHYLGTRCLVLENNVIRSTLLLDFGAAMVEYRYKPLDINLVWRTPQWKQNLYRRVHMQLDEEGISDNYLGGWFDIFPNYGRSCNINGVRYANHGELLYLPWSYQIMMCSPQKITIRLYTRLSKQACCAEKELTMLQDSTQLQCALCIKNMGGVEIPYQWGIHPTIGAPFLSPDCEIILPHCADDIISETIQMPPEGNMEQKILTVSNIPAGSCRIRNNALGMSFCMSWEHETFAYAQVWISAGHHYGHHKHGGAYAACVIPCSTPHESLSNGSHQQLYPGEVCRTKYDIYLEDQRGTL